MNQKKNLLLISLSFPPHYDAESILSAKYYCNITNFSVDVITLSSKKSHSDPFFESYIEKKINHIYFIKKIPLPTILYRLLNKFNFLKYTPDINIINIIYFLYQLRKLNISNYEILVSRSSPVTSHIIAFFLVCKNKVKWLAQFSDPWINNPFIKNSYLSKKINLALESALLNRADFVTYTSFKTMEKVIFRRPTITKKSRVLSHTFDPSLYHEDKHAIKANGQCYKILYCGSFYKVRTPYYFLDCLNKCASVNKFELHIYGEIDHEMRENITRYQNVKTFIHDPVPYIRSLELMKDSDLLLSIDANITESEFLPSKIIDYIGSNKPIISITPELSETQLSLKETGLQHFSYQNPQALIEFLNKFPTHFKYNNEDYSISKKTLELENILNKL